MLAQVREAANAGGVGKRTATGGVVSGDVGGRGAAGGWCRWVWRTRALCMGRGNGGGGGEGHRAAGDWCR